MHLALVCQEHDIEKPEEKKTEGEAENEKEESKEEKAHDDSEDGMWEETFNGHDDSKPRGRFALSYVYVYAHVCICTILSMDVSKYACISLRFLYKAEFKSQSNFPSEKSTPPVASYPRLAAVRLPCFLDVIIK